VLRLVTFFFNQLATLPLLVVALTILVQSRFSWRALLLFPILLIAAWGVVTLANVADVNASINELIDFRMQFPNLTLKPVPLSEYLNALRNKVPRLQNKRSDEILPLSAKLQNDRISNPRAIFCRRAASTLTCHVCQYPRRMGHSGRSA